VITEEGTMEHFVNGDYSTAKEYTDLIKTDFRIPASAAENLIIKQGRLESTAYIKGGLELTKLLEKVSGSYEYKKEYEQIMAKTLSTEKVSFNLSKEISDIKKQKKKLEQMEGYMTDSKDLLREREEIVELIEQAQIVLVKCEIESLKEEAIKLQQSIDQFSKERNNLSMDELIYFSRSNPKKQASEVGKSKGQ
jgi:structural maintenance of chromosome 1